MRGDFGKTGANLGEGLPKDEQKAFLSSQTAYSAFTDMAEKGCHDDLKEGGQYADMIWENLYQPYRQFPQNKDIAERLAMYLYSMGHFAEMANEENTTNPGGTPMADGILGQYERLARNQMISGAIGVQKRLHEISDMEPNEARDALQGHLVTINHLLGKDGEPVPEIYMCLGETHQKLGDAEQAREALMSAQASWRGLAPERRYYKLGDEIQEKLQSLPPSADPNAPESKNNKSPK